MDGLCVRFWREHFCVCWCVSVWVKGGLWQKLWWGCSLGAQCTFQMGRLGSRSNYWADQVSELKGSMLHILYIIFSAKWPLSWWVTEERRKRLFVLCSCELSVWLRLVRSAVYFYRSVSYVPISACAHW